MQFINTLKFEFLPFIPVITAYDEIWFIGNRFVTDRLSNFGCIFVPKDGDGNTDSSMEQADENEQDGKTVMSYIAENFDASIFTCGKNGNIRSVLGRFKNTFATAINDSGWLPKYIVVVIEDDILRCVNFPEPGFSELFGHCLHWLAFQYKTMIDERKEQLPVRAKRHMHPLVFWATLPLHKNFDDNETRDKFNQCLESVIDVFPEMKVLKLRKKFTYDDNSISVQGRFTASGNNAICASIDEAIQFWENGRKSAQSGGTTYQRSQDRRYTGWTFIQNMHRDHRRNTFKNERLFGQQRDRFHWNSRTEKTLPRPRPKIVE